MPQKKFRMFLSSKNTQTTAYHRFHAIRQDQSRQDFQMNAGCCGNRNPLKGWRKEKTCCLKCCTRTQRVEGTWETAAGVPAPPGTAGHVFNQWNSDTNVNTYGTLLEAAHGYGIFEMSDCNSAFALSPPGSVVIDIADFRSVLCVASVSPPVDTYAPCQSGGKGTSNSLGWQMVLKNVQDCCKPSQLKMIQNRAASSPEQTAANGGKPYSVSGKIDRNYNYNYRQYLKKRCMIADYDNRSGARQKKAVDPNKPQSVFGLKAPCCSDCSGSKDAPNAFNLHYKRNNWGFRKQGAVDNGLYIATKKIYANPCCAGKLETDRDTNDPVTPDLPIPNPQDQNQPKKEEVEVPRIPVLAKEAGGFAKVPLKKTGKK